jgi:hypothetical protein
VEATDCRCFAFCCQGHSTLWSCIHTSEVYSVPCTLVLHLVQISLSMLN